MQVQPATASVDASAPALVSVVVAGQDIPFGTTIEAHKLTTIQWPADAVPPGTYRDFSTLLPADGTEPRRAKRAMSQGELVLANTGVSGDSAGSANLSTLTEEKRCCSRR